MTHWSPLRKSWIFGYSNLLVLAVIIIKNIYLEVCIMYWILVILFIVGAGLAGRNNFQTALLGTILLQIGLTGMFIGLVESGAESYKLSIFLLVSSIIAANRYFYLKDF